jgi:hypothetical protein
MEAEREVLEQAQDQSVPGKVLAQELSRVRWRCE